MEGHVYILVNSAFPNLIKIGYTTKTPQERAGELSGTGTPSKFVVAYSVYVRDCEIIEAEMHQFFRRSRHSEEREFFDVSAKDAIEKLIEISSGKIAGQFTEFKHGKNDLEKNPIQINLYLAKLQRGIERIGINVSEVDKFNKHKLRKNLIDYYLNEVGERFEIEIKWVSDIFVYKKSTIDAARTLIQKYVEKYIKEKNQYYQCEIFKKIYDDETIYTKKWSDEDDEKSEIFSLYARINSVIGRIGDRQKSLLEKIENDELERELQQEKQAIENLKKEMNI
jgi:hypothetical protein